MHARTICMYLHIFGLLSEGAKSLLQIFLMRRKWSNKSSYKIVKYIYKCTYVCTYICYVAI